MYSKILNLLIILSFCLILSNCTDPRESFFNSFYGNNESLITDYDRIYGDWISIFGFNKYDFGNSSEHNGIYWTNSDLDDKFQKSWVFNFVLKDKNKISIDFHDEEQEDKEYFYKIYDNDDRLYIGDKDFETLTGSYQKINFSTYERD